MKAVYTCVAGLDVHKRTVVATRMHVREEQRLDWETHTFGSTTPELLALHDWLQAWSVSHVAMESTGDYWKPVYNLLTEDFEVWVVNAQHVRHVPGRKTDVGDAQWLAELMLHGLLKPSFIPPAPQQALRDLTRYRIGVIQERTRVVNRVQKLLEAANIKLASVVSDVQGVSARAMLAELAQGNTDVETLAQLARGKLRDKLPELQRALTGRVQAHQRFLLSQQLAHIDFLDEQVAQLEEQIAQQLTLMSQPPEPPEGTDSRSDAAQPDSSPSRPDWHAAVALLDTVPGINPRTAEVILAEIGVDMSRFPTANHLARWAGVAPGNQQSGGKRYSGRTTKGNRILKTTLVQCAHAAARTKGSFLNARYHRLAARRGKKRALMAVAHSMLIAIWHMLTTGEVFHDLGSAYYDQRSHDRKLAYYLRQLEQLIGAPVQIPLGSVPA